MANKLITAGEAARIMWNKFESACDAHNLSPEERAEVLDAMAEWFFRSGGPKGAPDSASATPAGSKSE